jgi:hypothetical protein
MREFAGRKSDAAIRRYWGGGIISLFQALICAIISARITFVATGPLLNPGGVG